MSYWRAKAYDVLPALSVRGKELRASLRIVTLGWMFGSVWMASTNGSTMINFGYLAHFNGFHWGLLASLGFAATLMQLPASYVIERTGLRKIQFMYAMTTGRLMWLLMGLMPIAMLILRPEIVAIIAMALIFISGSLNSFGITAWTTWMSDLIPPRIRGRYFARRNMYTVLVQIIVTLGVGVLLDRVIVHGAIISVDTQPRLVWTLAIIFLVAGMFGAMDILSFRRVREVVRTVPRQRMSLREIFAEPLRNKRFVHYVGCWATLTFATSLSGPFFGLTCQRHLGFGNVWTNIITMVCGSVGGIISSRMWGSLVDRWGRRPTLLVGITASILTVWGWLLIPPIPPLTYMVLIVTFVGGEVWTGISLAETSLRMSFTDKGGRSTYIAAAGVIIAVAGMLGGQVGGLIVYLADKFGMHVQIGPFVFISYHLVFFLSGIFRAVSLLWLVDMPDPGSRPTGQMVREMGGQAYQNFTTAVSLPIRLVSWPVRAMFRSDLPPGDDAIDRPAGQDGQPGHRSDDPPR